MVRDSGPARERGLNLKHAANGTGTRRAGQPPLTAFRFILVFGIVSALMDIVYEGARSVTGPFLGVLGASALLISVVTGAGEAVALVLRLVFGYLADRPRLRWALAISGYGLTALSVPLLGITNALWIACLLVLAERLGKAVRSPAKDAMLAEAGTAVGRGKAFAFHEALDQIGAIIGPLLVGASLSLSGSYGPGFILLALPGIAAMLVLFWLRRRVPDTSVYEPAGEPPALPRGPLAAGEAGTVLTPASAGLGMPRQFLDVCGVQQPDDVRIRDLRTAVFPPRHQRAPGTRLGARGVRGRHGSGRPRSPGIRLAL